MKTILVFESNEWIPVENSRQTYRYWNSYCKAGQGCVTVKRRQNTQPGVISNRFSMRQPYLLYTDTHWLTWLVTPNMSFPITSPSSSAPNLGYKNPCCYCFKDTRRDTHTHRERERDMEIHTWYLTLINTFSTSSSLNLVYSNPPPLRMLSWRRPHKLCYTRSRRLRCDCLAWVQPWKPNSNNLTVTLSKTTSSSLTQVIKQCCFAIFGDSTSWLMSRQRST